MWEMMAEQVRISLMCGEGEWKPGVRLVSMRLGRPQLHSSGPSVLRGTVKPLDYCQRVFLIPFQ